MAAVKTVYKLLEEARARNAYVLTDILVEFATTTSGNELDRLVVACALRAHSSAGDFTIKGI